MMLIVQSGHAWGRMKRVAVKRLRGQPLDEAPDQIKAAIEERFIKVALDPAGERKFPVGPDSAKRLGYDPTEIDGLPPHATESFAGVGKPPGPRRAAGG
jgi:hypothetical protein